MGQTVGYVGFKIYVMKGRAQSSETMSYEMTSYLIYKDVRLNVDTPFRYNDCGRGKKRAGSPWGVQFEGDFGIYIVASPVKRKLIRKK